MFRDTNQQFYLFSQLIFCVSRVFPCFDQPDLKAILDLQITCHNRFDAAANGAIILMESHHTNPDLQIIQFEATPPISTYLWTLNVGTF